MSYDGVDTTGLHRKAVHRSQYEIQPAELEWVDNATRRRGDHRTGEIDAKNVPAESRQGNGVSPCATPNVEQAGTPAKSSQFDLGKREQCRVGSRLAEALDRFAPTPRRPGKRLPVTRHAMADNLTLSGVAGCAVLNMPTRGRDRRARVKRTNRLIAFRTAKRCEVVYRLSAGSRPVLSPCLSTTTPMRSISESQRFDITRPS